MLYVLPQMDFATARRAAWLAMRPTRLQRVFLLVLAAALLALCGHLVAEGESVAVARGGGKGLAMAMAVAAVYELLILAGWRMSAGERGASPLVADAAGINCRRFDLCAIPWRDFVWWDASRAVLLLRVRTGGIVAVPKGLDEAGWQKLRVMVAARVPHANRAESKGWYLILALLALLIAVVVGMLAP